MANSWDEEARIVELMERIQGRLFPRRVRIKQYFVNFDKLRTGRVTSAHFARAIDLAGVELSEEDCTLLAEHFTDHSPKAQKPQVVNYLRFCTEADEVFGNDGLQDTMKSGVSLSPGSTIMSTFIPNSVEDEERFNNLLHKIATLCKTRGVQLKTLFTDLDRAAVPSPSRTNPRRGGKCTKEQFVRSWPFKKEISKSDLDLLCERYAAKGGDVSYMALHNEVSEVLTDPAQPFATSPLHLRQDDTAWSHATTPAVSRVASKVVEKRGRLREFFQDFDPLRKGYCTPGQVKTVLTIMNIAKDIDRNDYEELMTTYTCEDGRFCYKDFCAEIDAAFTQPGLERNPLLVIDMPDHTTTIAARRNTIKFGDAKASKIDRAEGKIRTFVNRRRLEMKPLFQDFDRTRRGYVSRSQFQRVLCTMGVEDVDERTIGLLCNQYCDFGNHNDFNYTRFLKSVDPIPDDVELAMVQLSSPFSQFKSKSYFDSGGRVLGKSMSAPML